MLGYTKKYEKLYDAFNPKMGHQIKVVYLLYPRCT
jgi:hypothetical protein